METRYAQRYHLATKHSLQGIQQSPHYLDWANEPFKYKVYPELHPLSLPVDLPTSGTPALEAVSKSVEAEKEAVPGLSDLAYLLYYSAGITKKMVHPQGQIYFRAAASAGALYPVEIYLVCSDLPGLDAGVYHFSPARFALSQLRSGDLRGALVEASGSEPAIRSAPVVLIYTGITWRSAWKYRARAYRYLFWDCGTILSNSLAAAAALDLPAKVVMGFVDASINHLIGIDENQENSLALFPVGYTTAPHQPLPPEIPGLELDVRPLSEAQVEYPLISEMHAASAIQTPDRVRTWRAEPLEWDLPPAEGKTFPLHPLDPSNLPRTGLEEVIVRRGSSRRFRREPIAYDQFSTILERATADFPADWLSRPAQLLNDLYINVHAVEGLPAGAYFFRRESAELIQLKQGNFRAESAHLCLGQDLGGDASATLFFLADLEAVLRRYGDRGYRLAQMEAGIIGGRIYLSAYALGLGASGLTFFDDDVIRFFSPYSAGMEAIFVVALGVPGRLGKTGRRITRVQPGEKISLD